VYVPFTIERTGVGGGSGWFSGRLTTGGGFLWG
jgi:hypothetical protein